MNRTLYIKDEDAPLWERARELSNDRLSPVIVEALRKFVADKEADLRGVQRIVVEYDDAGSDGKPTAKAFFGRWLIAPDDKFKAPYTFDQIAIADTPKGGVVIFSTYRSGKGAIATFGSFKDAFDHPKISTIEKAALNEALRRRGVPVEELDV